MEAIKHTISILQDEKQELDKKNKEMKDKNSKLTK